MEVTEPSLPRRMFGQLGDRRQHDRGCTTPAHRQKDPTAGFQGAEEPFENCGMIRDPVHGGIGKGQVELGREVERLGIGQQELQVVQLRCVRPAREPDHIRRVVDPENPTIGDLACDFGRELAVTTSDVQHPLRPAQCEPFNDAQTPPILPL